MRELNNIILREYDCAPTADELFVKLYEDRPEVKFLADTDKTGRPEIHRVSVQTVLSALCGTIWNDD